ncbi:MULTISPECIES: hypothetical protein [Sphingomonadaceae]|jgi:hypothetical protein|uniref:DUF6925 family protein n=1 Tax=Sphingomonadales TaxID=204457 RepID=UPI000F5D7453|nr:hypothetical protein [Novosphingobium sp. LASN5T]RQW37697.1 hypothetical protein EH199_23300 [Novosphingobium sp. LASN5T]
MNEVSFDLLADLAADPANGWSIGKLASILRELELLDADGVMTEVLRAQPRRVLLSPAGRVEVYHPIPTADGKSPIGPHTHLVAKLVVKDRPHSSNVSIPEAMQSALSLHPRSSWRNALGDSLPCALIPDRNC